MRVPNGQKHWIETHTNTRTHLHTHTHIHTCTTSYILYKELWKVISSVLQGCHEVITHAFKIRLHDSDTKKALFDFRESETERYWQWRRKKEYICMFFRKVLIIMTSPPWTCAPAEVTNVQHCQFVWDYASWPPWAELETRRGWYRSVFLWRAGRENVWTTKTTEGRGLLRVCLCVRGGERVCWLYASLSWWTENTRKGCHCGREKSRHLAHNTGRYTHMLGRAGTTLNTHDWDNYY